MSPLRRIKLRGSAPPPATRPVDPADGFGPGIAFFSRRPASRASDPHHTDTQPSTLGEEPQRVDRKGPAGERSGHGPRAGGGAVREAKNRGATTGTRQARAEAPTLERGVPTAEDAQPPARAPEEAAR